MPVSVPSGFGRLVYSAAARLPPAKPRSRETWPPTQGATTLSGQPRRRAIAAIAQSAGRKHRMQTLTDTLKRWWADLQRLFRGGRGPGGT